MTRWLFTPRHSPAFVVATIALAFASQHIGWWAVFFALPVGVIFGWTETRFGSK